MGLIVDPYKHQKRVRIIACPITSADFNVWYSDDFGATWNQSSGQITGLVGNIHRINVKGNYGLICMGGTAGLSWYTNDGGDTWQNTPYSSNWIATYAVTRGGVIMYPYGGFNYTLDGGDNWANKSSQGNWHAVSEDGGYLYSSYTTTLAGQIRKSIDFGTNWSTINVASSDNYARDIVCSKDGSKLVLSAYLTTDGNDVYYSSDYGETWTGAGTIGNGSTGMSLFASADCKHVLMGDTTQGYVSHDYGHTWTDIFVSGMNFDGRGCVSENGKHMVLITTTFGTCRFYYSDDYGDTWSVVNLTSLGFPNANISPTITDL